jgi:hypothetical protein
MEAVANIAFVFSLFIGAYALTKIWRAFVRDVFAWSFMLEDYKEIVAKNKIHHPEEMAQWAYQLADAAMKERSK